MKKIGIFIVGAFVAAGLIWGTITLKRESGQPSYSTGDLKFKVGDWARSKLTKECGMITRAFDYTDDDNSYFLEIIEEVKDSKVRARFVGSIMEGMLEPCTEYEGRGLKILP